MRLIVFQFAFDDIFPHLYLPIRLVFYFVCVCLLLFYFVLSCWFFFYVVCILITAQSINPMPFCLYNFQPMSSWINENNNNLGTFFTAQKWIFAYKRLYGAGSLLCDFKFPMLLLFSVIQLCKIEEKNGRKYYSLLADVAACLYNCVFALLLLLFLCLCWLVQYIMESRLMLLLLLYSFIQLLSLYVNNFQKFKLKCS